MADNLLRNRCGESIRWIGHPHGRHDAHRLLHRGRLVAADALRLVGTWSARCRFGSWVAPRPGRCWCGSSGPGCSRRPSSSPGRRWCSRRPGSSRLTMSCRWRPCRSRRPGRRRAGRPRPERCGPSSGLGQRHADVVLVLERSRSRAALGAVDDDEVGGDLLLHHGLADRQEVDARADAQLEAGRLAAGQLAQAGDERASAPAGSRRPVVRRADTDSPSARRGSSRSPRHLGPGQDPAQAGFGALAELERDHLDLVVGGLVGELVLVEAAVLGAGAEVARADLPDQVATVAVVRADQPPPRCRARSRRPRAGGSAPQCVGREGTEAHRRDVEQGHLVGAGAVRPADADP